LNPRSAVKPAALFIATLRRACEDHRLSGPRTLSQNSIVTIVVSVKEGQTNVVGSMRSVCSESADILYS
jgi:hypothetical protein